MRHFFGFTLCLAGMATSFAQAPPGASPVPPPAAQEPEAAVVAASELHFKNRTYDPGYPVLAQMGRISGVVHVRTVVDPGGMVQSTHALDGPPVLRKPAEAIMAATQFNPVLIQGKPARVVAEVPVPFKLPGYQDNRPETPVTGFVLHTETTSVDGAPKLPADYMEKETTSRLGNLGLVPRDPGAADPATTLDLTLKVETSRSEGGHATVENLVARASLLADKRLDGNQPGQPDRVWFVRRIADCPGEAASPETFQRLLVPVMQTLMPYPDGSTARQVDFDFRQIRVKYSPPAPPYPPLAKVARIQGPVVVLLVIDPTGKPISATAIDGPRELHECAANYVMNWRFFPAQLNGVPQFVKFKMTLSFTLK